MHIILLVLLVLSGLVWGIVNLQREIRRRQWAKQNTNPLFSIEGPRELAATILLGLLKCGGEITREEKKIYLNHLEEDLNFAAEDAAEMFSYATYLLSTDPNYPTKLREIAAPSLPLLSEAQRRSIIDMAHNLVSKPTDAQSAYRDALTELFSS